METQGVGKQSSKSHSSTKLSFYEQIEEKYGSSKAFCKCGEGWTCVITRTEGPDAGKTFFKCGGNCSCVIEADGTVTNTEDTNLPQELQNLGEAGAYCKCGEGWSCVITKIEEPEPTKAFYDCAESCNCVTEP